MTTLDQSAGDGAGRSPRTSAGLLAYRVTESGVLVFLAHMGGPFWARREKGAWSIPKGEFDPTDLDAQAVARREFAEEIGVPAPAGEPLALGSCRQPSGKVIWTFAVAADPGLAFRASNDFHLEWPRGSGQIRSFPEVDRAQWFDLDDAAVKLVPGQVPILSALARALGQVWEAPTHPAHGRARRDRSPD